MNIPSSNNIEPKNGESNKTKKVREKLWKILK
jgi:hypothetical protein